MQFKSPLTLVKQYTRMVKVRTDARTGKVKLHVVIRRCKVVMHDGTVKVVKAFLRNIETIGGHNNHERV